MRWPRTRGNSGNVRWSFEPPILLTLPFAVFAIASLCAGPPFVPTRWLGSLLLVALCVGSIVAGVRRAVGASDAERNPAELCSEAADSSKTTIFDAPPPGRSFVLTGTCSPGQIRVALTFAGITVAAIAVVAFLLAGQVQRAGPTTAFGIVLSLLLICTPASMALHIAVRRVSVQFMPGSVRVVYRKGLVCRAYSEWDAKEIQSLRLVGSTRESLVFVAIEGRSRHLNVPLWGLAFEHAQAQLSRAGCPERWRSRQN